MVQDAPSLRVHVPTRRRALVTALHRHHAPPRRPILRGRRPRTTPVPDYPPCRAVTTGVPDYPPCRVGRCARRPTTGCLLHHAEAGAVARSMASAAIASGPRSRCGPLAMAWSRSRRLSRRRRPSRRWTMRMPGIPFRSYMCMLNSPIFRSRVQVAFLLYSKTTSHRNRLGPRTAGGSQSTSKFLREISS